MQERAKKISPKKIRNDFFDYIKSIEQLFFQLNAEQLEDSLNAKGKLLKHKNSTKFPGVYSEQTEIISRQENPLAPKKAGDPYNFLWTGDFFSGFIMWIKNGTIEINSTGTGANEKAAFFNGYKDLFGLTDEHLKEIIDEKLMPFMAEKLRNELGL